MSTRSLYGTPSREYTIARVGTRICQTVIHGKILYQRFDPPTQRPYGDARNHGVLRESSHALPGDQQHSHQGLRERVRRLDTEQHADGHP